MNRFEPLKHCRTEREEEIEYMAGEIISENGTIVEYAQWMLLQELLGQIAILHDKMDYLLKKYNM